MVANPNDPGSQVTHRDLGMREKNTTVEGREPGDKCHLFLRSSDDAFHWYAQIEPKEKKKT